MPARIPDPFRSRDMARSDPSNAIRDAWNAGCRPHLEFGFPFSLKECLPFTPVRESSGESRFKGFVPRLVPKVILGRVVDAHTGRPLSAALSFFNGARDMRGAQARGGGRG
jgi:hypothetical protein